VVERAKAAKIRVSRPDLLALAALFVLPVLVFAVPALLGHTVLLGDDFTQNYPLRAFVGSQIRHGHLPLFDPYIWSGAPLLGGWNAGAAYPFTFLFVIFPATAAWTLNLLATWWVAGIGCYLFLRASRLSVVPSFLGALSFIFAGAMTSQLVHFGLVAGMSWVPVSLLALLRLSERETTGPRLLWTALLAVSGAMAVLAGEPRAIADYGVIVAMYALWRALKLGHRALPFAGFAAAGLLVAVALGAIQWLPGAAAVSTSQRAGNNVYLFSSGSLPNRWVPLMLVPDLLGGSGSFGQPSFFASYNLTEVTGYIGLMPLVASFALLGRLRLRRPAPEWLVWQLVALVGMLLALGGNTPLWHILIHIPFFGGQRLQSRNVLIADMGFAFLLAYWSDTWLGRAHGRDSGVLLDSSLDSSAERSSRLAGAIPALLALATVIVAIAWGAGLLHWFGVSLRAATHDGSLRPWFIPSGFLALGALSICLWGHKLNRIARGSVLFGFVVLDIVIFTLLTVVAFDTGSGQAAPSLAGNGSPSTTAQSSGSVPASASTNEATSPGASVSTPTTRLSAEAYAGSGRFAIYDPDLIDTGGLNVIGAPDLNVLLAVPSVQGYSSIVDGLYASVTGSHSATGLGQDILSPAAIGDGTLDQLGLRVLFAPRDYFLVAAQSDIAQPVPAAGRRQLSASGRATWYFGENLLVSSVVVPDVSAASDVRDGLRFGLVDANGETHWAAPPTLDGPASLRVSIARTEAAVGLVAEAGTNSTTLGAPSISSVDGTDFVADGQLEGAVVPPRWGLKGFDGSFAVFADHDSGPALSVRGSNGATVRALSGPSFAPTSAAVYSRDGVEVIRSEAAIPGWRATWQPASGHTVELQVRREGLIQAVEVPPGRGVVAWTYEPPRWTAGWLVSVFGLLALLAMCIGALLYARSPRRT